MDLRTRLATIAIACATAACTAEPGSGTVASSSVAGPDVTLRVDPWPLPAPVGAAQPDLVAAPDGSLLLSWIQADGDGHALRFARHGSHGWSAPRAIARGDDWFVNWADTPHIVQTADGALWAHWLRKSAAATYAYDVVLARSSDAGGTWSAPIVVNGDGTATEHGFASLWPSGPDSIGIAWLDGRATAGTHGGHGGHGKDGHGGHATGDGEPARAMTLRTVRLDAGLARHDETELDAATCDCCQTGAACTRDGFVLAYRDRTGAEVRDISVVRHLGRGWLAPQPVHADGWVMPACPVNGPAVAARDTVVLVAWYTGADGRPRINVARSGDGGARFAAPLELDAGSAVLGRVDASLDADAGWVAWVREAPDGQTLHLARLAPDLRTVTHRRAVARIEGRGRGTGVPQLALAGGRAHLAWTEVVDGRPRLRGAIVSASRR